CIRHAASVRPEPGSNSPRKFVAHFESDEIDLISIAPVIRPSRLYSLVVQFSKIKLRFVTAQRFSSNSYIISSPTQFCKLFLNLFSSLLSSA
ncbi:hypothetical protein, partial [Paenibacillus sp. Y412MC10]|uniref:hypothetical protein n=1 Tax=Geobacillus sp. (strain Y412MC10) TaxID=481743 RepID=UPI001C9314D1